VLAPSTLPLLLALALLTGATAAAQAGPAPCEQGVRSIVLKPESSRMAHEICVTPWLATVLSFDTDIVQESVTLEGAERFVKVEAGDSTLKLVPSEKVLAGERLRLTLLFRDKAAPMSVAFWVVVHPARPEPLVEVYRQKRTAESCQQEVTEKDTQLRQCREQNARLSTEGQVSKGLADLLDAELMNPEGVVAKSLTTTSTLLPGSTLMMKAAFSYRSSKRVALEVWLEATRDAPPWTAAGAELVGPGRRTVPVLSLRQQEPVRFGEKLQRVLIEAEAPEEQTQGTFTLKLWDAEGVRSITLIRLTFP
jgi:uncharacterized protein (TIGR02268 family)